MVQPIIGDYTNIVTNRVVCFDVWQPRASWHCCHYFEELGLVDIVRTRVYSSFLLQLAPLYYLANRSHRFGIFKMSSLPGFPRSSKLDDQSPTSSSLAVSEANVCTTCCDGLFDSTSHLADYLSFAPMLGDQQAQVASALATPPPLLDLWSSAADGHHAPTSSRYFPMGVWTPQLADSDVRPPAPLPSHGDWSQHLSRLPAAPPSLPEQFMACYDDRGFGAPGGPVFPPFSCFLNPDRRPMYHDNAPPMTDINNNIIGDYGDMDRESLSVTSTGGIGDRQQSHPASTSRKSRADNAQVSQSSGVDSQQATATTKSIRSRLRQLFPQIHRVVRDYLAELILAAMHGDTTDKSRACTELENITLPKIRAQLMERVPGLKERGISFTTISRLILPLNTRILKNCLQEESAWHLVAEELGLDSSSSSMDQDAKWMPFDRSVASYTKLTSLKRLNLSCIASELTLIDFKCLKHRTQELNI